jgi:cysteinyl-tRNA synthetase
VQEAWVLGFDLRPALAYLNEAEPRLEGAFHVLHGVNSAKEPELLKQLDARRNAKLAKDYATSDAIRHALEAQGLHLVDRAGGWTTVTSTMETP